MADRYISDAEVKFLLELVRRGTRFMVVGMQAAIFQGVDRATEDIDLWFESMDDPDISAAAEAAGGIFERRKQMIVGRDLHDIDIVSECDGLGSFKEEYRRAIDKDVGGIPLKVLPLRRVITSKKAARRPKDLAALPSLEAALVALQETTKRKGRRR